jgi:hypothetical protein
VLAFQISSDLLEIPMTQEPTQAEPSPQILSAVEEWRELKSWLAKAKDRESELRTFLSQELFPNASEGTQRKVIGNLEFKMVAKMNRSVDLSALDSILAELPEGSPYRDNYWENWISFKPSLNKEEFDKMPEAEKRIASQCITEKPGMPTLEVTELELEKDPTTAPASPDWPAQKPKKSKKAKEEAPVDIGPGSLETISVTVDDNGKTIAKNIHKKNTKKGTK